MATNTPISAIRVNGITWNETTWYWYSSTRYATWTAAMRAAQAQSKALRIPVETQQTPEGEHRLMTVYRPGSR
ncbi:MAG TPA: hypothetical protein VMV29_01305 [Ktedonobacterales bacterium]|nr:hypothetical protein [Ktedonobacterales bacterium]